MKEQNVLTYDLSTEESRAAFIKNEESSLFGAVSEEGYQCAVTMEQHVGMEIIFYQPNGWARMVEYDHTGHAVGESFEKYQMNEEVKQVKEKKAHDKQCWLCNEWRSESEMIKLGQRMSCRYHND